DHAEQIGEPGLLGENGIPGALGTDADCGDGAHHCLADLLPVLGGEGADAMPDLVDQLEDGMDGEQVQHGPDVEVHRGPGCDCRRQPYVPAESLIPSDEVSEADGAHDAEHEAEEGAERPLPAVVDTVGQPLGGL